MAHTHTHLGTITHTHTHTMAQSHTHTHTHTLHVYIHTYVLFKRHTVTGIKEFLNLFVLCIGELVVSCLKGIRLGGGGGGGGQWLREGGSCQSIGELVASCLKGVRQTEAGRHTQCHKPGEREWPWSHCLLFFFFRQWKCLRAESSQWMETLNGHAVWGTACYCISTAKQTSKQQIKLTE